jgi:hypothetical protein
MRFHRNIWALLIVAAVLSLLFAFGAQAAEFKQLDREGYKWSVSLDGHIDSEYIEFQASSVKAKLELITWENDTTRFIVTTTDETNWKRLRSWAKAMERAPRFGDGN